MKMRTNSSKFNGLEKFADFNLNTVMGGQTQYSWQATYSGNTEVDDLHITYKSGGWSGGYEDGVYDCESQTFIWGS